ncbi:NAD(P)/FAD-dependent oxidoreductase [Leucobacter sp. GX24907]
MNVPGTADLVVVGGGIVGVATAAAAASRGQSVVLIEKEEGVAREGSSRAQGSLRVQGRHEAEFPLALQALGLWQEAAEEAAGTDADFEFVQGGNLYMQTSADERPVLEKLVAEAHASGLTQVELLDADQAREVLPAATGDFHGAMWSPIDAAAQPATSTKFWAHKAERLGAELRFGVKALRIEQLRGGVHAVHTSAGRILTERVVVACGVWTPHLAKTVGIEVPIMPVVMSELETAPLPPVLGPTIRAFGFGARQRPNGRTVVSAGLNAKVGHDVSLADLNGLRHWLPRAMSFRKALKLRLDMPSTLRQVRHVATHDPRLVPDTSPEPRVDRPLVDGSLARMSQVIPAFKDARVSRYWAGLVDMTPDGLPVIDGNTGVDGLVIVTGLAGHGLHLGPVLGEIATELAFEGRSSRPIDAFRLARFDGPDVSTPKMMI